MAEDQIIWWGIAGNWNNSLHWSPTVVPDTNNEFAWIQGGGGTYTVDLDISPNLFKMQSNDTTVTVRLNGNSISVDPGPLVNEGTILANTGSSTLSGPLANTNVGHIDIAGGATLSLGGPSFANDGVLEVNSQLVSGAGVVLTQQAGHRITGRGRIAAAVDNYGEIAADVSGHTLYLVTNPKTNHNLIRATGGGEIEISGITLDNTGGVVRADGGTVTLAAGTTLHGGTLERTGISAEVATGAVTLQNVTHSGEYRINAGTTTTVRGATFVNNGLVAVNYNSGTTPTFLSVGDSASLQGTGTVNMARPADDSQIKTVPAGAILTQGAGHTIHGRGQIHPRTVNAGTIRADVNASTLTMAAGSAGNPLPSAISFTSRIGASGGGATFELALPQAADVHVTLLCARGNPLGKREHRTRCAGGHRAVGMRQTPSPQRGYP